MGAAANQPARIDAAALGLVLVVGPDQTLMATVTGRDIRRALLAGLEVSSRRSRPC